MRTLVDRFRTIVRHRRWIQRPGIILALLFIVLAFLAMVQQWTGPTMRLHRVLLVQAHYTTPTGSIPDVHNGYLRILDTLWWSFPLYSQTKHFG